jgi:hypothetical protein
MGAFTSFGTQSKLLVPLLFILLFPESRISEVGILCRHVFDNYEKCSKFKRIFLLCPLVITVTSNTFDLYEKYCVKTSPKILNFHATSINFSSIRKDKKSSASFPPFYHTLQNLPNFVGIKQITRYESFGS